MKNCIRLLSIFIFLFILVTSVAVADIYHAKGTWSITGASPKSNTYNWTPAFNIPSGNLYVKAMASCPSGVSSYFTLAPDTWASTVGKIAADGSLHQKSSSFAANGGTTYKAFSKRWDPSLTVILTNGKTYFYSTNNS